MYLIHWEIQGRIIYKKLSKWPIFGIAIVYFTLLHQSSSGLLRVYKPFLCLFNSWLKKASIMKNWVKLVRIIMSKLKNNIWVALKPNREEPRNLSPALCVERVSHTNIILSFTLEFILERNHSLVISAGLSFTQSSSLKIHINIHTREKPYCSHCDKKFSRSGDLEKHKLVHTGEKPYTCDQCGKSFVLKQHFTAHVRVHTGEKPYKCLYCDKRFSQSGNLKTHKRIHTGEKPYHCTACGKCFNHSASLHSHTKNYHSKQIIFISDHLHII